jgi:hypothetical protein
MQTITINNKPYPVLARYSAVKLFCDKKGIDFFEFPNLLMSYGIGDENFKPTSQYLDDMALIMLCFLLRGAEANGTECNLTISDIIDWIQDNSMAKIYELIAESQGPSKNVKATEKKKAKS